ncbi:hypothetical protein [Algoriphagus sediminis]|uniref:DUF3347 domain-containing protein n=1 Tax=Algoriphagus sediminis TaxID=3057113 RepID=A0ABT7YAC4_9BACT|nr:hypothetical protein [Algoriphagus sediminis]MDN3203466.1 hypothetical protein [Algoriphagus sediminis]
MKKLILATLVLFLVGIGTTQAQGLKVPSTKELGMAKDLLDILNNTEGMDISSDQKSKLESNNKDFVADLLKTNESKLSDDEKKEAFLGLKNKRVKFLTDLLGSDLFKKYSGQILKAINPLKSKLGLAALAF